MLAACLQNFLTGWTKRSTNRLFQKLRETGSVTDVSAVAGHAVLEQKKTSILLMI